MPRTSQACAQKHEISGKYSLVKHRATTAPNTPGQAAHNSSVGDSRAGIPIKQDLQVLLQTQTASCAFLLLPFQSGKAHRKSVQVVKTCYNTQWWMIRIVNDNQIQLLFQLLFFDPGFECGWKLVSGGKPCKYFVNSSQILEAIQPMSSLIVF